MAQLLVEAVTNSLYIGEGEIVAVGCCQNATLMTAIRANGDIYAEEKSALPSDGELELTLTLDKVTTDQDGQRLICEASTSYPPEQSTARQYTEISVNCE
ncbi:unnamed protein product [Hymenolepis diminuta]|uniref:Ig-like domain-containing protein n=1 Tax=Hymenolepis diminuta TaxID=6216 RepID=A0A0R3SIM9_HYMDI|nr:unnamed protein product [Hymenolepis diminuta]